MPVQFPIISMWGLCFFCHLIWKCWLRPTGERRTVVNNDKQNQHGWFPTTRLFEQLSLYKFLLEKQQSLKRLMKTYERLMKSRAIYSCDKKPLWGPQFLSYTQRDYCSIQHSYSCLIQSGTTLPQIWWLAFPLWNQSYEKRQAYITQGQTGLCFILVRLYNQGCSLYLNQTEWGAC